jgi:DNA-binding NtrC family response regulator
MCAKPADPKETATLARPRVDSPNGPAFAIVVVSGPDRGRRLVLDGTQPSRALIGQSPVCALRLSDPTVSRRHAALELCAEWIRLTDLGSTNATWVNDVAVLDGYLRGGETLRIGETTLRLEPADATQQAPLSTATSFGTVVGASLEMRRLYPLCERLAASDVPVVIEGETGTGKEAVAEALHESGARASGPFVIFDCTAVPPTLVESELFGHERGAFTGAVAMRRGLFEQAKGGTLLIDEIGDLDVTLQPKLLRAIERSAIRRVGGDKWIDVDARVLAATRRDLDAEVQVGRFRDDLFYRLAVARIELPPLRKRAGDIALLTRHFWKSLGGADTEPPYDLLQRHEAYAWPGNVRELYNAVARHLALGELSAAVGRGPGLSVASPVRRAAGGEDFIDGVIALALPLARGRERVVDEYERRYVERVLAQHGGNVRRAAAASGIARRYFQVLRARQSK